MVKLKDNNKPHWHWVILILALLAIGFCGYTYKIHNDRLSALENEGEWECVDNYKVTWQQCSKMSELTGEGVRLNADYWLSQLNGRIIILKGNHDKNNSMNSPIERMNLFYGGKKILLLHNPADIEKIDKIKFDLILCGHVHEKWKKQGKIINVGVDVWNFMPISLDEIIKEINS